MHAILFLALGHHCVIKEPRKFLFGFRFFFQLSSLFCTGLSMIFLALECEVLCVHTSMYHLLILQPSFASRICMIFRQCRIIQNLCMILILKEMKDRQNPL